MFIDVSIAVVDLLQEMTDVDTLTESEEGANILFDALVSPGALWILTRAHCGLDWLLLLQLDGQVVALLVQNMERLDETVKEESDGVHNTLGEPCL